MGFSGSGNFAIDFDNINIGTPYSGGSGYGTGTIDGTGGGFVESIFGFNVGTGGGNTGVLTLNGAAGPVDIDVEDNAPGSGFPGAIRVGVNGGIGTMFVQSGASLVSTNSGFYDPVTQNNNGTYYNINIGRGSGANGTVTVDGTGSFLGAYGLASRITVGRDDGIGLLNIQNGGSAGSQGLVVGRGGTGVVNVMGAGSEITLSDTFGQYSQYQGNDYSGQTGGATIGRQGGTGTLNITDGGVFNMENTDGVTDGPFMNIGRVLDSTGFVLVSGVGSQLNLTQNGPEGDDAEGGAFIGVGRSGQGTLTVESGGTVNVIGDGATIHISNDHQTQPGEITGRESLLEIRSGGVVNVDSGTFDGRADVAVAHAARSNSRLTVDGAGSQLNITSDGGGATGNAASLQVGREGTGVLDVINGGQVLIDGNGDLYPTLQIGRGAEDGSIAARGTVTVDGAGSSITLMGTNTSTLASDGFLAVGRYANTEGTLSITNGGSVSNTGVQAETSVGSREGSRGTVLVDGAGSSLDAGSLLIIGASFDEPEPGVFVPTPQVGGEGSLSLSNGATLIADEVLVGASGFVDLTSTVTGNLTNFGYMEVGDDTVGTVSISGDFTMEQSSLLSIDITDFAGGVGDMLTIGGAGVFDTRRGFLAVEIEAGSVISIGDSYTVASATGGLTAATRTVYDITSGIALELSQSGNTLILTALEAADGSINGTSQADILNGTSADDTINGLAGADTINGMAGADTMAGGTGNDRYFVDNTGDVVMENAGEGLDYIFSTVSYTAAANTERLYLEGTADIDATGLDGQDDVLVGNSGNNRLDGKSGADMMRGGLGNDTYFVDNAADVVDETNGGGGSADFIFTTTSFQIQENVERLIAVEGATGAVGLTARNNQNDILIGNSSTNVFVDQFGRDIFIGGGGNDFFRFIANLDAVNNVNRINDFNSVDDQFQLQRTIYSQIDVGILDPSEFVLGTAAGDADDRIIYDSTNGVLYYDPDGTGATDQIEFANVTAGITIVAEDFQIF